jgi:hypothetical protein
VPENAWSLVPENAWSLVPENAWSSLVCTGKGRFPSLLIAEGRNIVQVSRLLGHHSPAFTLGVYAHLMDDGTGGPLDLDAALAVGADGANAGANITHAHSTGPHRS